MENFFQIINDHFHIKSMLFSGRRFLCIVSNHKDDDQIK